MRAERDQDMGTNAANGGFGRIFNAASCRMSDGAYLFKWKIAGL
jgi:hypothetical protein